MLHRFARVAALAALAAAGCSRAEPQPNVLLVVVDTLRADHLGSYGYARPTSPHLDALAHRGARFTQAHSTTSWTAPSVVSILTGLYPAVHGVEKANSALGDDVPLMAEAFARAGYATAAMAANPAFVSPRLGIGRGFERFDVLTGPIVDVSAPVKHIPLDPDFRQWVEAADAKLVTDRALAWIAEQRGQKRPWFLYLHYLDPHADYFPPPEFAARFGVSADAPLTGVAQRPLLRTFVAPGPAELATLVSLYDAEIAFADHHLGRLFAGVEQQDRPAIITVTADHGEEFGDHGGMIHGITLYEEQLHVPLIVAGPGAKPGVQPELPVSLTSVWATLAELARIPAPPETAGASLAALARGEQIAPRALFADLDNSDKPKLHRRAVLDRAWKLLERRNGTRQLFDLATDAHELHDLSAGDAQRTNSLASALATRDADASASRLGAAPATIELSPEDRARMKALGYE